jgi:8-oxo-dGTP pyrophosphatase MutT (NUDIX family)
MTAATGGRLDVARVEERLAGRAPRRLSPEGLTRSAVLVLLHDGPDGLQALLTQRSDGVRDHQRQVAFPGGVAEPGDADEVATAIRESVEEVGLDPARIRLIGRLDDYRTITGYHVTPIVAATTCYEGLSPRTGEISEVFAFPVERMGDPRVLRIPGALWGRDEDVLFVAWHDHLIWGATARMLHNLLEIVT